MCYRLCQNFGVSVISVDISPNVALIGQERAREAGIGPRQVVFVTADATQMDYPTASFDIVYSLATLFYIADKVSLLERLHVSRVWCLFFSECKHVLSHSLITHHHHHVRWLLQHW